MLLCLTRPLVVLTEVLPVTAPDVQYSGREGVCLWLSVTKSFSVLCFSLLIQTFLSSLSQSQPETFSIINCKVVRFDLLCEIQII